MYRGAATGTLETLGVTTGAGGIEDPESHAAADLVIGVRSSLDTNFFKGNPYRLRAADAALTAAQMGQVLGKEQGWFA